MIKRRDGSPEPLWVWFWVQGSGFRVQGSRFRVQASSVAQIGLRLCGFAVADSGEGLLRV